MVGMGSNLLVGLLIVLLCRGIAVVALGCLICGIFLWRKKRSLSLAFLIPSVIYLALFSYLFIPRPLPHHLVTIDLRKRTDLSGIPVGTRWFSDTWPAPKVIVPLSPPGGFSCVEGRVDLAITLPDGQTIRDTAREVYIHTDDIGIWKILIDVDSVTPGTALENLKSSLWPIAMASKDKEGMAANLADMDSRLKAYVPKAPLALGFRLAFPAYKLDLMLGTTFISSDKVSYFCQIELPHVPEFERFTPLPSIDRPEQLVQESREVLESAVTQIIPKAQWPSSIAHLHPKTVYAKNGNLVIVFDCHAVTGSHCYVISLENQPADDPQVHLISVPYPGVSEVGVHN